MISFKHLCIVLESYKDAKIKWTKQGHDIEDIDTIINLYKQLKDRNIIKDENSDIGKWMNKPFSDFVSFVISAEKELSNKESINKLEKDFINLFTDEFSEYMDKVAREDADDINYINYNNSVSSDYNYDFV